ncbi:MAG: SPFH domain-containing protein [Pseudomonadota bacterium]
MENDVNFNETDQTVRKSSIGFISSENLPEIIQKFNQEANSERQRSSILKTINFFGISLFKYRILALDQVRLVQRNGKPELAGYSGKYQRRKKVWSLWKPWTWFRIFRDNSSTIGIYKISDINERGYIGYGDKHLISVSQGEYAKAVIDGKPVFLDEGTHVIKTNNFSYAGKVTKSLNFIQHENLYRIQVPSVKIAAVLVDNNSHLLKTGIYFIRSNNFTLIKKVVGDSRQLFHNSADSVIQCGSLLRLMPTANTVAVYYQNGKQQIFPENNEKKETSRELIVDDANIKFSTFLSTNLINRHYPSTSRFAQFEYYTKDSVKVGVRLFVAYRIFNPVLALQNLEPTEIDKHIEYVTHVDMAVAGQKTSLQGIQSSDDLQTNSSRTSDLSTSSPPPDYNQVFISVWQDFVKAELTTHLKEYGIELVRLNIEEIKILDKEVEKKISEQSYRVAEANAKLAIVEMERHIFEQKARTDSVVAEIKANQEAGTKLIAAKNQEEVAQIEKKIKITAAEAETERLKLNAIVFSKNPVMLDLELTKLRTNALKHTDKVISLDPKANNSLLGLISSAGMFNLPLPSSPRPNADHPFSNSI